MYTDLVYEAGIYIFVLGLVVQSLYRLFDPLINKIFKIKAEEDDTEAKEEDCRKSEEIVFAGNRILPFQNRKKSKCNKIKTKDLIGPPIVGLFVAYLFWPATVFDYMPFQPQFPLVAYVITALLISRISNAEHDSFKVIGEFFMGMIHRIYPPIQ